jgi:hypothetical protein
MMPVGVRPATAENPVTSSNRLGRATVKPMATTSLATAEELPRCRKISRSSTSPIAGARMKTDRTSAGMTGHPQSVRAWKYMAADT